MLRGLALTPPLLLSAALAAASPAPDYGPSPSPAPPAKRAAPDPVCQSTATREIIVCAQRKNGYRLDPDVMEARREIRGGGQPRPPEGRTRDNSCATVGPFGCVGGPTIDLVNAATVLATMATKAVKGENVGEMFVTNRDPDEYQLYLMAKARRQARESEQALAAAVAKMKAERTQTAPVQDAAEPSRK